ncbi:terminase small subunit [Sulfurimonas sp.]|uniref:terminase small subunit n=1 Tax=Sulfurimonas sp. TaxID=2022749 RepID=UPI00356B5801
MATPKLTAKQKKFCEEYLIDLNATQAAIRAGYSKKTAAVTASENLNKPNIKDYIAEKQSERSKRTEVTADMVVEELAKIAFGDVRKLYNEDGRLLQPHELDAKTAASISSFKASSIQIGGVDDPMEKTVDEYKRYDKTKTLELLGRHLGMFKDKVEHSLSDDLMEWLQRD